MNTFELYHNLKIFIESNYNELKEKEVVIYPFGQMGLLVKQMLNEQYGIHEKYIVDNGLSKYNQYILSFEDFQKACGEHTIVVLTAVNNENNKMMATSLRSIKNVDRIINIIEPVVINAPRKVDYFKKLKGLLRVAKIKQDVEFVRVGRDYDGGYLMINDFNDCDIAYSFGISDDVSWDRDIVKKNIDVFQYDPTIHDIPEQNVKFHFFKIGIAGEDDMDRHMLSLNTILEKNGHGTAQNMILKMDVEGAEWQFIESVTIELLDKFDQIVFEMHGLTNEGQKDKIFSSLQKLNQTHQLIWIHGNNYARAEVADNILIPDCIEVLYVNKNKYDFEMAECVFPLELDQPNHKRVLDFKLGNWGEV